MTHAECIRKLENWFNKNLKSEQMQQFKKRVEFIPTKVLENIIDQIIDENPPMPGRFPTVNKILSGWYTWKQAHPEFIVKEYETECHHCNSHGFLWFSRHDDKMGHTYDYVARCSMCVNWKKDANEQSPIPLMHKNQIGPQNG